MLETQVIIVGAGPVGLTLALDLGRSGVRCTLIERNETSIQLPKMERCNARTMEIYRRLGVAEKVRDAGLPRGAPDGRFSGASHGRPADRALAVPRRSQRPPPKSPRTMTASRSSHTQFISQYTLEPLLRSIVESSPPSPSASAAN